MGSGSGHRATATRSTKNTSLRVVSGFFGFVLGARSLVGASDASQKWQPLLGPRRVCERAWSNENDQADRAISTGQLHPLLGFHIRPIDVVVYHGSDREYWF
jgi:hypothetical protein